MPIVNLQCDIDHPTQTLADLCWLRERFPDGLAGKTIAVSWAYSPSYAKPLSVPQGLITLLTRFGMHVRLAHPEGYDLMPEVLADRARATPRRPAAASRWSTTWTRPSPAPTSSIPRAGGRYDLMLERVDANRAEDIGAHGGDRATRRSSATASTPTGSATSAAWPLTRDGAALYMHCLPADIGAEVTARGHGRARVDLAREANKKVYVIMALLAVAKGSCRRCCT